MYLYFNIKIIYLFLLINRRLFIKKQKGKFYGDEAFQIKKYLL